MFPTRSYSMDGKVGANKEKIAAVLWVFNTPTPQPKKRKKKKKLQFLNPELYTEYW